MSKKMYSAFISSVYRSLRDERNDVIQALLDCNVHPFCMEHFTVSSSSQFQDIEDLIDSSDAFILILGGQYGTEDGEHVSWTQREYEYALKTEKLIVAIKTGEYVALKAKVEALKEAGNTDAQCESLLPAKEWKQYCFGETISFAQEVSKELTIYRIVAQFLHSRLLDSCPGWVRNVPDRKTLALWRETHPGYELSGLWYHVHLSEKDRDYFRLGTLRITQAFEPESYRTLSFYAENFGLEYYDEEEGLVENGDKKTCWEGTYTVDDKNITYGMFTAHREFRDKFKRMNIEDGFRRGVHSFTISWSPEKILDRFHGTFIDADPKPKQGIILVFRTPEARLNYLKRHRPDLLKGNNRS